MKERLVPIVIILCALSFVNGAKNKSVSDKETNKQKNKISQELRQMFYEDQEERSALYEGKLSPYQLSINDSIRLARVIELDKNNQLLKLSDKYYAAWIYHHGGGSKMNNDSLFSLRTIQLCNEIITFPFDEILIDTINLSSAKKTTYFKILHRGLEFLTSNSCKKVDTLLLQNSKDTLLVFHMSLKESAKSLKSLAEQQFNRRYGEFKDTTSSIDLNRLFDPEYYQFVKDFLKGKIRRGLQTKPFKLTDEEIDLLVNEQIENLKKIREGMIKDAIKKYLPQDTMK